MSWLTDTAEHLEDVLTAQTVGTTIFYDTMPDTPDACIALYDAGGSMQPQGVLLPWQECRLEVRVRSTTRALAMGIMDTITTALNGKYGVTMNTTTKLQCCRLDSEPAYLRADQRRRVIILARYTLQVQRGTYIA